MQNGPLEGPMVSEWAEKRDVQFSPWKIEIGGVKNCRIAPRVQIRCPFPDPSFRSSTAPPRSSHVKWMGKIQRVGIVPKLFLPPLNRQFRVVWCMARRCPTIGSGCNCIPGSGFSVSGCRGKVIGACFRLFGVEW